MKKSKLLFVPFGTVSALAAVATPLLVATSCSSAQVKSFDLVANQFDYKGGQTALKDAQTRSGATVEYVGAIQKNPELFIQDYVNYLYTMEGGVQQSPDNWKQYNISISTPTIGSTTVEYPGEGTETYATISFTISVDSIYEYQDASTGITINKHEVGTLEYKNIPFFVYPDPETGVWKVGIKQVLGIKNFDNTYSGTSLNLDYSYILQYMQDSFGINGSYDLTTTYTFDTVEGYQDVQKTHNDIAINSWKDVQTIKSVGNNLLTNTFMDFDSRYLSNLDSTAEIVAYNDSFGCEINVTDSDNSVKITGLSLSRYLESGEELPELTIAEDYDLPFWLSNYSSVEYTLHIGKGAIVEWEYPEWEVGRRDTERDYDLSLVIKSGSTEESRVCVEKNGQSVSLPKVASYTCTANLPKTLKLQGEDEVPFSVPTNATYIKGTQIGTISGPTTKALAVDYDTWSQQNDYENRLACSWILQYDGADPNLSANNAGTIYNSYGRWEDGGENYVFVNLTNPNGVVTPAYIAYDVYTISNGNYGIYFPDITEMYDLNQAIIGNPGRQVGIDSSVAGDWTISFLQTGERHMYSPYIYLRDKFNEYWWYDYDNRYIHDFTIPTADWSITITVPE